MQRDRRDRGDDNGRGSRNDDYESGGVFDRLGGRDTDRLSGRLGAGDVFDRLGGDGDRRRGVKDRGVCVVPHAALDTSAFLAASCLRVMGFIEVNVFARASGAYE